MGITEILPEEFPTPHMHIAEAERRPIRVGVLSRHSMDDPDAMSGTPYRACLALAEAGLDVVDVSGIPLPNESAFRLLLHGRPSPLWARDVRRSFNDMRKRAAESIFRRWDYQRTIRNAERLSAHAQELIDAENVDIIVGVCVSTLMYNIRPDRPMVYASDTTARLINSSYARYLRRSDAYRDACDHIERAALSKCAYFVPAAKCAAESAVNDYGMPRERVRLVEFGAHVLPDMEIANPDPPSRDRIELSLVAADPIRKRLDLCIEIAEVLNARGWSVTLNYVGPHQPIADNNPVVNWCGRLRLGDPVDRAAHQDIMHRSHFMLLPSKAEAFGIAPCEAAHFGRPSVVSNAGGLPTVIQHDRTGIVMPLEATAAEYATAIERVSSDPDRYRAMSQAALHRARTALSWPVWADRMKELITEVLAGETPCRKPLNGHRK
jgi:glycosyltransferase involved in cell wall biosynthesis